MMTVGMFFQGGWSMLVSSYPLLGGEFMVFKYDGHSAFDIKILNSHKSKKQKVVSSVIQEETKLPTGEEDEEEVVMDQPMNSAIGGVFGRGSNRSVTGSHVMNLEKRITDLFPSDNPFFVTKFKNINGRKDVTIPHTIRKGYGLKFGNRIKIQDPKGNLHDGKIAIWKDGRHAITNFWKQLCMFNNVMKDDIVICELIPSTTNTCRRIKVQIIHPNTD
ncbi:B3 domain-containing protein REM22-like [Chenopodium quinoa]|uniref:TF-B3 domain-containing protein n=1 Tax=Chenopodium quinoa TaxID=63459 RepID=A0A803LNX5_CHEQI|nr:B3 domain-containing protein REM22-like [Chenopodium quinoa]